MKWLTKLPFHIERYSPALNQRGADLALLRVTRRNLPTLQLGDSDLVRVGDSQRFAVVAFSSDGSRLENAVAQFRSSNPTVATIDGGGNASGVSAGTATIHVDVAGRVAEATLIVN